MGIFCAVDIFLAVDTVLAAGTIVAVVLAVGTVVAVGTILAVNTALVVGTAQVRMVRVRVRDIRAEAMGCVVDEQCVVASGPPRANVRRRGDGRCTRRKCRIALPDVPWVELMRESWCRRVNPLGSGRVPICIGLDQRALSLEVVRGLRRDVRPVAHCAHIVVVAALQTGRMGGGDAASFGSVEHGFDLCIHDEDSRRIFEVSTGNATNNGDE